MTNWDKFTFLFFLTNCAFLKFSQCYMKNYTGQSRPSIKFEVPTFHYNYPATFEPYEIKRSDSERDFEELGTGNENAGLFPNIFNLATYAIITTNATCGEKGPENYCKLVEHVYMRSPQCEICDDALPSRRHPIDFAVDGSNRWWQSPSLANGLKYEWVTITMDLRQQYQIAYVIIKVAIAPRPGNWILERSLDGVNYKAWQYYAVNDEECERAYGIKASSSSAVTKFLIDDQVICTSYYSRLDPLEDGEIHTSLVNGRPGIDGPSLELQEFTKARFVRFRFQRLKTLNSDLIYITRRKHHFVIDESVTRRYFYAIRDISIGGQCICYGHSDSCPVDPATGQLKCECKHNTCGESCNECCPLFNQKLWRHGTNTNHHACEPCQCFNHADRCVFDPEVEKQRTSLTPDGLYEGGGVCVDCKHNTRGLNCQECKDKFYRSLGVSQYSREACRPCDCDLEGSFDDICIKDESMVTGKLKPGDCHCKPGFGGPRCDRCAPGFRNYPICDPCPCNRAGSANFETCDHKCLCKDNVEGELCDTCKTGHYNLDESNPFGCTKCFCFGLSEECTGLGWGKMEVKDLSGWTLSDLELTRESSVINGNGGKSLTVNIRDTPDRGMSYWKAPLPYLGDKLASYGSHISYFFYYVVDGPGLAANLPDLILKNGDVVIEHHSRRLLLEKENASVHIRLHESADWFDRRSRLPATKEQLMTVLSNLQVLAVRSIYHQAQVQSSIYAFTLESASKNSTSQDLIYNAEKCSCPAVFTGLSCEGCLPGHRRVNNVLFGGQCEACSCHGHSQACDPFTGHCSECSRNTTGSHCELCAPGFYGNPSLGADLGTCLPCGCPLLDSMNNFSPTCTLTSSIESGMQDYACTACPTGYEGPKCEWCVDDFFGQPMVPGNFCQPCNCSGNVDLAAIGNCDKISGRCLKCIGNTIGYNCELCKPDYYGSALQHDCKACRCNLFGSVISQCDSQSGVCQCKPHFVGPKCDRCEDGYGDVENGCQLCSCDSIGSFSNLCDPFSGQCQCKPGVFGKRCDSCLSGYYGFGDNGCDYCNCYTYGSVDDGKCDVNTGQCFCREHVRGEKCDTCEDGYYNITSGSGCKSCDCHSEASLVSTCDSINGQCRCKDGVTGLKCDRCSPNFFGLSENGCQQCPLCPAPGHVCDPVSGQCVCPPYTIGEVCEHCAPNSWNYDAYKGCQPCECDTSGSTDASCDALTGACKCRSGYTGKKCDQCTLGHYKFPSCFKCNCNQPGTESSTCSNQTNCSCDDHGECLCKKNVAGEKCDKCNATAFSLEADNPKGCTECFCFKLTPFCIQSSYIWRQVTSTERRMAFFDRPWVRSEKRHGLNVLPAEPSTLNVYQTRDGPLYWSLPSQFLGDKITSYNGYLRLRITNQNGNYLEGPSRPDHRSFDRYPLIVLVGNYRIVLEHYKNVREISDEGIYIVKFREDMWKNQLKPKKEVDRQTLMIALQNVQAIFVRATFVERISEASLADVSMDVGISQNSSIALSNPSIGVEHCDCPTPYAGASCQHPADGHCRKKKSGYLDSENDLDLIGTSIPCSCHSHSNVCDMETCRCLDCQHNTTGDFCEQCSTGFYGNAKLGTEFDCRKCACPLIDHSFSKSCYATTHNDFGYVCDQCHAGHTGVRCEKCVNGYFGDPLLTRKPCQLCACNKFGSLYDTCDSTNGQCQCRHGVTGRDCSECRPRYALIGSDCRSCDLGCTRELMIDADHLESVLMSHNFTGLVPAPWGRLTRVENTTSFLEAKFNKLSSKLDDGTTGGDLALKVADAKRRYLDTQTMHASAQFTRDSAIDTNKNASIRLNESESLRKQVGELSSKLRGTKDFLVRYKESGPAGGSKASVEAERMLNESTGYLKTINEIKEIVEKRSSLAEQSLKDAEQQLRQVKAKIFNDTITKQVAEKLQTLYEVVDDARKIVFQNVWRNLSSAESTLKITQKMLTEFERLTNEISMGAKEARKLLDNSSSLHSKSIMSNLDADAFFSESRDPMLDHLKNATNLCEDKVNQFNQLYPEYEQKYLLPARRHADELVANADHIKNLFSPIQDKAILPVDASASYANIKLAIDEALSAASGAVDAAKNSFDQVSNDKKFVQQSKTLLNSGENLLNTTLGMQHTTKGLTQETSRYRTRQQTIQDTNLKTRQSTAQITKFDKFDDIAEKVEDSIKLAKEARAEVDDLAKRNNKLQDKINELNKSTKSLSALDGKSVAGLADAVKNAVAEIKTAQEGIKLLEHSGPEFDLKISNMSSSIAKLKEKIKEAREKASKVKISVHSKEPDTCYRSYISTAVPSPANSLYIEYRPTDNVDNSLIFVTKTNQTRARTAEYLALQLIDQRFMFLWNVGGGTDGNRKITLPHRIISTAKKSQPLWYKINVERKGNGANLTVGIPEMDKTKPDNQMAVYKYYSQIVADPDDQVTNLPESDSPAIFNTIPGLTRVSLGLYVDRQYIPRELNVAKFLGTVGQVKFDGNNVPLWNFIDSAGACTPYYSSMPAEIATTDYMFADGYAQIPRTGGYNSQTTYVIIKFASYSENGLLYFRGNPTTKDFISIELEDGRIKTQINLGGNSKTRLLTEHNYNDGKRYVVQVRRSQLNASLEVTGDKSESLIQLIPGNFKGLEADTDHMIGGVAESYTKHIWRSFNIQWKGFYGCIMLSTLNVDNKYLTINDANVKTFSLKPTCRMSDPSGSGVLLSADRVVTFKGDGSFVITGLEIKPYPVSSFSVNFRTRKDKGLIFYQSSRVTTRKRRDSPAESGFIAGYIEDCLFNLAVGTNSDNVVHLESPIKVCDGRLHTAFFKRKELEILLFVDDQFVAKGKLSQNRTIGNKEWSQLFLGGLGSIKAPKEELSSYTPFTGCISDLHFNYRRLILVPQRLDKATLGVCVNPASEIPQSQQKEGYLSDGIDQYEQEDAYDGDDEAHPDSLENFDDDIMMSDASSHRHRGLTHHKFKKRPNKDNSNENIQSKCELVPDNHIAGAARYGSSPGTYSSPGLPVRKRHERILE